MALPKRGSRRILVEGVTYRWIANRGILAVQQLDTDGTRLEVGLARQMYRGPAPIYPHQVAALIQQARSQGWRPEQAGPPFRLPNAPPRVVPENEPAEVRFTEDAWLAATDPLWLLRWLKPEEGRASLLLAVATLEQLGSALPELARRWARLVEAMVERDGELDEIDATWGEVLRSITQAMWDATPLLRERLELALLITEAAWLRPEAETPGISAQVGEPVANLVREVFGNPFREPLLQRSGVNLLIRTMAKTIYEERAFADLPILADALEEAECASDDILSHLREPGPHVRGCWALDLVLHEE